MMRTMNTVVAVALAGLTTVATVPLQAQQGPPQRRGNDRAMAAARMSVLQAVDFALENGEALGLDEAARNDLQLLRQEAEPIETRLRQEREELRQELQELPREERRARRDGMRELRDRHREAMDPIRDRFHEILTEDQRDELRRLMRAERDPRHEPGRRPGRRGGGG